MVFGQMVSDLKKKAITKRQYLKTNKTKVLNLSLSALLGRASKWMSVDSARPTFDNLSKISKGSYLKTKINVRCANAFSVVLYYFESGTS